MNTTTTHQQREREDYLTANLQRIAHDEFPDNTHNTWTIDGFEHRDECVVVAATPDPDDVGYPSFKFMVHFDAQNDAVTCVGNYCFENGGYSLLGSRPDWTSRLPRSL